MCSFAFASTLGGTGRLCPKWQKNHRRPEARTKASPQEDGQRQAESWLAMSGVFRDAQTNGRAGKVKEIFLARGTGGVIPRVQLVEGENPSTARQAHEIGAMS